MAEEALIVLSTFGSIDEARSAVHTLVGEKLAACGNLLPGVESIYRWKGEIETAQETMVVFKTTIHRYDRFEARLRELHSYEVPEIVSIRIQAGHFPYLNWIDECCMEE